MLREPSIAMEDERPTDVTPGTCAIRSAICWCIRTLWSSSFTSASGIVTRSVSTSSGWTNPGCTRRIASNVRIIRPEPTSSTTRQAHLGDDQHAARAVTFAAVARASAALLEGRSQLGPREPEDRDEAEQHAGEQRQAEREEQDHRVDADLVEPRQLAGAERDQQADAGRRETQAERAAQQGERDALPEQSRRPGAATTRPSPT